MTTIREDAYIWAKTFDITGIITPADKQLHRDLDHRCNCPYIVSDDLEGVVEVQQITNADATGGVFDIRLQRPANGGPVSYPLQITADIVWNADAATMQAAIDLVAPGSWPDYVPGDIKVTGGPAGVGGATITLTWSGASVHGRQLNVTVLNSGLTGGVSDMVPSNVTEGRHARFWFAALKQMGIITGTDPGWSDAPAGQYTVHPRGETENWPSNDTIRKLVKEASVQEWEDWETEILVPLNISF